MKKLNRILIFLFLMNFVLSCNSDENKKEKINLDRKENKIQKEYIPSKDPNNVFKHLGLDNFEATNQTVMFSMEYYYDSAYKKGELKNFEDIDYKLYNKNISLDSLIDIYAKKYNKPIYFVNYKRSEGSKSNMAIELGFNYNKEYYLHIKIYYTDPKFKNRKFSELKDIKYFLFCPFLVRWEPYTFRKPLKADTYDEISHIKAMNKRNRCLDKFYKLNIQNENSPKPYYYP